MEATHQEWIDRAIAFYKIHDIEPFRVVDLEPISESSECGIRLYFINGTTRNIISPIDKDLMPYLLLVTGHLPDGMSIDEEEDEEEPEPVKPDSFRGIYKAKKAERIKWLPTQTIPLSEISGLAHQNTKRIRPKPIRVQRWAPYIARVEERDLPLNSYRRFNNFWHVTSKEKQDDIDKILRPDKNSISMSANFPCPDCKMITPHFYLARIKDSIDVIPLDKSQPEPTELGRVVKCVVCDAMWSHQVDFKGMPESDRDICRIVKK